MPQLKLAAVRGLTTRQARDRRRALGFPSVRHQAPSMKTSPLTAEDRSV